mmetsp:Transcript_13701/g.31608  ORF Transcript_13701/g.31608 Transcript_13701/m.31608 type:complete len:94 (-) Transcript_13701:440-721(-)
MPQFQTSSWRWRRTVKRPAYTMLLDEVISRLSLISCRRIQSWQPCETNLGERQRNLQEVYRTRKSQVFLQENAQAQAVGGDREDELYHAASTD